MVSLDQVLGNEPIKEYFRAAVSSGHISHSYLIEGERGSGKKLLAQCFARMLQCETGKPDCDCVSCRQIDHGNHPDVISVRHEKTGVITVKEIREQVVGTAWVRPYKGPFKIYIIDEAEKLRLEAQNALLKTIEEPPDYVVIILLAANKGALLETILSRCLKLNTGPVAREEIYRFLEKQDGFTPREADFAAGFCMGNPGKALEYMSSETFSGIREMTFSILKEVSGAGMDRIAGWASALKDYRNQSDLYLNIFLIWYRDILVLKTTSAKEYVVFQSEYENLRKQCDILSLKSVNRILELIDQTKLRIRANVNFEAQMLLFLTEICQNMRKQPR